MAPAPVASSPGWAWASRHVLADPTAAAAMQFQARLEGSQWLAREQIWRYQAAHLCELARHALVHVPYYAERQQIRLPSDPARLTPDEWRALPVLRRRDVQQHMEALRARGWPATHGKATRIRTSGSTGMPIEVLVTALTSAWHNALTLRSMLWAFERFDLTLAIIRHFGASTAQYPAGDRLEHWAGAAVLPCASGAALRLDIGASLAQQADWLMRSQPSALFTYPSNLDGLLREAGAGRIGLPPIEHVLTIGETLSEETRGLAGEAWHTRVHDIYSAEEVGYIALQCPSGGGYHVPEEAILVEVLDDDGRPCAPGQIGRVVVTALHNYATPLLRYEIGDYAEAGATCTCGRGLMRLPRIMGRQRNLLVLPSGQRHWPSFGTRRFVDIAPIRQHQIVQVSPAALEARLVVERPLTAEEEANLTAHIQSRLPMPLALSFRYVSEIPRSPRGKFEDFVSLVA